MCPLIVCEGHPEAAIIIIMRAHSLWLWPSSSVEGESGRRQAATPLADETEDVLTLWTVSGLQGEDGQQAAANQTAASIWHASADIC